MGRSWSGSIGIDGVAYLRKKRRCDSYLSTKLEEAQLHCYLESCACVAAATTTACAIRQHDDHLRLVSAHISSGVHSSSFIKLSRNQDLPSLQEHLFGPVEFSFDP